MKKYDLLSWSRTTTTFSSKKWSLWSLCTSFIAIRHLLPEILLHTTRLIKKQTKDPLSESVLNGVNSFFCFWNLNCWVCGSSWTGLCCFLFWIVNPGLCACLLLGLFSFSSFFTYSWELNMLKDYNFTKTVTLDNVKNQNIFTPVISAF